MRKINYIVGILTILLIVIFTAVRTPESKGPPAYNAASETTATGVVEETREFFCAISDEPGAHIVLRTNDGKLLVHLGPARFLRLQQFSVSPNDRVTVVGTRVNYQGQDAMLAREITRGNDVLTLRDHQGHPLWVR
ncbi:MAG TPA: hypothetical protein VLT90_12750 [Terriglobales bacterium]|nr:hypothetical protein [Terriglobales bacterium]